MALKMWTVNIQDDGNRIMMFVTDSLNFAQKQYMGWYTEPPKQKVTSVKDPETGEEREIQPPNLAYPEGWEVSEYDERDEAIGELFALVRDEFDTLKT